MTDKAKTFMFVGLGSFVIAQLMVFQAKLLVSGIGRIAFGAILISLWMLTIVMITLSLYHNRPCGKFRVIGWTKWDKDMRQFDEKHDLTEQDVADVEEAVVNEIRRKKYKFGGTYFQQGDFGCPVLNDHSVYMVTMRHWGSIMGRVWGGDYTEYAWGGDMGKVPTEHDKAEAEMMTAEEIEARDKWHAENRKRAEKEVAEIRKNRKAAERKQHKEDKEYAMKFVNQFFKKYGCEANIDVRLHVADMLLKVYEQTKEHSSESLKWILSPAERTKIKKQRKEHAKQALQELHRILDDTAGDRPEDLNK